MTEYVVTWRIDLDADTPRAAAVEALGILTNNDPANIGKVFEVRAFGSDDEPERIDLSPGAGTADVDLSTDQPARPTTTCGCGYELIWVEGHWKHDAAPSLWGDDHDPHPLAGPDAEAREYWDLQDGVTYAWRVVYQIRSLIDPGPNSVVGEDFVRVVAEDEDEAKAKAEKWVRENDTLYDDRIQPSLSILNIYEVD